MTVGMDGLTLDANDVRFLAARLRRLFEHFGVPVPGANDDARLIGSAGAAIGLLLTGRSDGVQEPRSQWTSLTTITHTKPCTLRTFCKT